MSDRIAQLRATPIAGWVRLKSVRMARRLGSRGAQPTWWVARRRGLVPSATGAGPDLSDVVVLSVYRNRNAAVLAEQLRAAGSAGAEVHLWCLDGEPVEQLAPLTVGSGPGTRCQLLDRLFESRSDRARDVVILDDDVTMTVGSIVDLVHLARLGGFGLAQPAHDHRSHSPHPVTARRPLSIARRTRFVEVGPLLYVDRSVVDEVLPMPLEFGMGWGLDLRWSWQLRSVARFGILDVLAMRHLGAVAASYALDAADQERMAREAARAGPVTEESGRVVWRPWRRLPG